MRNRLLGRVAMGCNPELVSAFLDGELDRVIVGSVTQHLLECEECCRTINKLAAVKGGLSERFVLCQPEDLTHSVMSAISNERIGPPSGGMMAFLKNIGFP
ncbi:MAG: zf-HC2 domain-containing protein [Magnetococcales bacterium]|nr:zf-HC2 domain-containing protein [Magnetococcales bacterium]MBF0150822.1 zf-HC2 domain-containing protein [Magnetococcales bacterium]MBF0172344.1 zf-HC2 domain-containing protein [Magnetococcales bacterium]MBF0349321.1 zf-HC2 domain-containing protein [Magnetococcales bacterium]MBF0629670.1 zf-HC2 domain-containing protein [Magnetococcales bacterium]